MTIDIACTSSVRPFSVPRDAGVGVFSFTSSMINLNPDALNLATSRNASEDDSTYVKGIHPIRDRNKTTDNVNHISPFKASPFPLTHARTRNPANVIGHVPIVLVNRDVSLSDTDCPELGEGRRIIVRLSFRNIDRPPMIDSANPICCGYATRTCEKRRGSIEW